MQELVTDVGTRIQILPSPEHVKGSATLNISNERVVNVRLSAEEMLELGKGLILEAVRVFERGENTDFNETT